MQSPATPTLLHAQGSLRARQCEASWATVSLVCTRGLAARSADQVHDGRATAAPGLLLHSLREAASFCMERWAAHGQQCAEEHRNQLTTALLWLSVRAPSMMHNHTAVCRQPGICGPPAWLSAAPSMIWGCSILYYAQNCCSRQA